MPQLTNYYFDLFHRDVEPIVPGSNRWGVQGEYVIDSEHIGYTNWVCDEEVQSVVPNGEDVVLHIVSADVLLDMDVVANSVEIGEEAILNIIDSHSLQIDDSFTLNGLISVYNNGRLTNAGDTALQLNGMGMLNLSGDGTSGYLGTAEIVALLQSARI